MTKKVEEIIENWQDELLEDSTLSSNAKLVGLVLSKLFVDNKTYPTIATMQKLTKIKSFNTIKKALEILEKSKYLEIKKIPKSTGGKRNFYELWLDGEKIIKI